MLSIILEEPSPEVCTNTVGITNPVAVPTILITASNASANDLYYYYIMYILGHKPTGGYFSWGIKNERLGDCT